MSVMTYGVVVQLQFFPAWLALPRTERRTLAADLYDIINRNADLVQVQYYDADALHGDFSDFMVCRTADLRHYHFMWKEIRDTQAYACGYFTIKGVIVGIENGFQSYEKDVLGMG